MRELRSALFLVFTALAGLMAASSAQEKTETRYQLVLTNAYYDDLTRDNSGELCVLVIWGKSIDMSGNGRAIKVTDAYSVGLAPSYDVSTTCAASLPTKAPWVFEPGGKWPTAFLIEYRRSLLYPLRQTRYITVYGQAKSKSGGSYELIQPKTKCAEDKCGEMDSILGFGREAGKKSEPITSGTVSNR